MIDIILFCLYKTVQINKRCIEMAAPLNHSAFTEAAQAAVRNGNIQDGLVPRLLTEALFKYALDQTYNFAYEQRQYAEFLALYGIGGKSFKDYFMGVFKGEMIGHGISIPAVYDDGNTSPTIANGAAIHLLDQDGQFISRAARENIIRMSRHADRVARRAHLAVVEFETS